MIGVVGNGRFFLLIAGLLLLLVMGSKWLEPEVYLPAAAGWIGAQLRLGLGLPRHGRSPTRTRPWFLQPMKVGEGRYLVFLVLMAFFWTSFNQIFMTLPEYIRDYADTSDLIRSLDAGRRLDHRASPSRLGLDTSEWGRAVLEHGQVKPEHLINLNAFGIIVGQVAIAYLVRKLQPLTSIILGSFITVISFLLYLIGQGGWIIVIADPGVLGRRDAGQPALQGVRRPHRAAGQGGHVHGLLLLVRGPGQPVRRPAERRDCTSTSARPSAGASTTPTSCGSSSRAWRRPPRSRS